MTKTTFSIFLIFFTLNSFGQLPNTINPAEKVYGLSQFWSDANYNFAYFDRIDKKTWDSTYLALIEEVQHTKNDYEY